jgi:hypothetical protein
MMRARAGVALLEILVAATLASLVMTSAALLLHAQGRIAQQILERSERSDAARSTLLTLAEEWRAVDPAADVYAVASESVATRIFRGAAVVCGRAPNKTLIRYRGLRLPDAAKDSALQLAAESTIAFSTVAADTGCPHAPGEQVLAIDSVAAALPGSMWLLFESGGYHLSAQALRYRRGTESRQPITNQLFDDRSSAFAAIADSITRAFGVTLTDRSGRSVANARIALLNAR